jgi:hypothetical protein
VYLGNTSHVPVPYTPAALFTSQLPPAGTVFLHFIVQPCASTHTLLLLLLIAATFPHPATLCAVRALQLGLSVVPRVDPRMPRSLADYCGIYREWLLLLRGRLAQSGVDLPESLFAEGLEGDEELMRFALCFNILQVKSSGSNSVKS